MTLSVLFNQPTALQPDLSSVPPVPLIKTADKIQTFAPEIPCLTPVFPRYSYVDNELKINLEKDTKTADVLESTMDLYIEDMGQIQELENGEKDSILHATKKIKRIEEHQEIVRRRNICCCCRSVYRGYLWLISSTRSR